MLQNKHSNYKNTEAKFSFVLKYKILFKDFKRQAKLLEITI